MKRSSHSSFFILHSSAHSRRGFTLVEMIVSLMIFSIVAVVALGALVKIVSANKKAQTLQASITNLNFAIDSMSREMQVGGRYYCDPNYSFSTANINSLGCSRESNNPSGLVIAFVSYKLNQAGTCNLNYAYRFNPVGDGTYILEKGQQTDCIDTDYKFSPIIDPNVTITGYYVDVDISKTYPRALIRISGFSGVKEKEKTYFDVQTAVSARSIL